MSNRRKLRVTARGSGQLVRAGAVAQSAARGRARQAQRARAQRQAARRDAGFAALALATGQGGGPPKGAVPRRAGSARSGSK